MRGLAQVFSLSSDGPTAPAKRSASPPALPPAPGCSRQVRIPEPSRSTSANPRFSGRGFGILEGAEQVHGAVGLGGDGELGVADVDNTYRYVDLGLSTYIGRDWIQLMGGEQLYAGYLQTPTREMVIAGGSPMPPGLVLFEVDEMATGSQSDGSDESCSSCAYSWNVYARGESLVVNLERHSHLYRCSESFGFAPSPGPIVWRLYPRSRVGRIGRSCRTLELARLGGTAGAAADFIKVVVASCMLSLHRRTSLVYQVSIIASSSASWSAMFQR